MLGGIRHRLRPQTGSQALISHLIEMHGGASAVARKIGVGVQAPINWRLRGRVPLELCNKVGKGLNLKMMQTYGLNYKGFIRFFGGISLTWPEIIKSFEFSEAAEKAILKLKAP